MRVYCKVSRDHRTELVLFQDTSKAPCYVSVVCTECGLLLWQCISNVIASTATTEHGELL